MYGLELAFLERSAALRLSELTKDYRNTVQGIGPTGKELSSGSCRVVRHKIKSSLQEVALVAVLLEEIKKYNDSFVLSDYDAVEAFMHMMAPKQRRSNGN